MQSRSRNASLRRRRRPRLRPELRPTTSGSAPSSSCGSSSASLTIDDRSRRLFPDSRESRYPRRLQSETWIACSDVSPVMSTSIESGVFAGSHKTLISRIACVRTAPSSFSRVSLAGQMDRNRHLDLFALCKSAKIGMDQPSPDRIDLPVLKNNVVDAFALDVKRKNRVDTRIRSQNRRQIAQRRSRRQAFRSAAVNDDRNLSCSTKPAGLVLAAGSRFSAFTLIFLP